MTHQFKENGNHYNGGRVFFGYGYSAIGEPRLSMVRKWFRGGEMQGKTEDSFYVDGSLVANYAAATEALKTPPIFTPEETKALKMVGDEPADVRRAVKDAVGWEPLHYLVEKGAVAWGPPGQCRRTDLGRAALAKGPT
ncbi:MAG: hypothetical protein WC829_14325 [Hyphomicrobium sp.]|jgi:hypothetical protein